MAAKKSLGSSMQRKAEAIEKLANPIAVTTRGREADPWADPGSMRLTRSAAKLVARAFRKWRKAHREAEVLRQAAYREANREAIKVRRKKKREAMKAVWKDS